MGLNTILLRDRDVWLDAEAPGDWLMIIKDVLLDANGNVIVDLSKDVAPGTIIKYILLSQSNVWGGTATTFEGLAITKGQAGLGTTSSTTPDFTTEPATIIPTVSLATTALIFYRASERAMHGEPF